MPPADWPTTCARPTPVASSTATTLRQLGDRRGAGRVVDGDDPPARQQRQRQVQPADPDPRAARQQESGLPGAGHEAPHPRNAILLERLPEARRALLDPRHSATRGSCPELVPAPILTR